MPNGVRRNINIQFRYNGPEAVETTDRSIQEEPGPRRIARILFENDMGNVFFDEAPWGERIIGEDGIVNPVGHTKLTKVIYRAPIGTSGPSSDDGVQIDAFSAGTPIPNY